MCLVDSNLPTSSIRQVPTLSFGGWFPASNGVIEKITTMTSLWDGGGSWAIALNEWFASHVGLIWMSIYQ